MIRLSFQKTTDRAHGLISWNRNNFFSNQMIAAWNVWITFYNIHLSIRFKFNQEQNENSSIYILQQTRKMKKKLSQKQQRLFSSINKRHGHFCSSCISAIVKTFAYTQQIFKTIRRSCRHCKLPVMVFCILQLPGQNLQLINLNRSQSQNTIFILIHLYFQKLPELLCYFLFYL